MAQFFRNLTACLAGILASSGLMAETPTEVSLDFTVFAFPDQPSDVRFAVGRGSSPPLEFHPTSRSPRYRYRGTPHVVFFRERVEAGIAGQPPNVIREQIGEVVVPSGIKEPLFVFIPRKTRAQRGTEYAISVIDDGLAKFPLGHVFISNQCNLDLNASIGSQKMILRQGPMGIFKSSGSLRVTCFISYGGNQYGAFDSPIECLAQERVILFLFPSLRPGSPTLQYVFLTDSREMPPTKKADQP